MLQLSFLCPLFHIYQKLFAENILTVIRSAHVPFSWAHSKG